MADRWATVSPHLVEHVYALVPELTMMQALKEMSMVAPVAYWAGAYAGSQMLARYVLDHPETVRDKRVVEIGAGAGMQALAAAKAGAKDVMVCDVDLDALRAVKMSAVANKLAVMTSSGVRLSSYDVVLAACLFDDAPEIAFQMVEAGVPALYGAQTNTLQPGEPFVELHRQSFVSLMGQELEVMVYGVNR